MKVQMLLTCKSKLFSSLPESNTLPDWHVHLTWERVNSQSFKAISTSVHFKGSRIGLILICTADKSLRLKEEPDTEGGALVSIGVRLPGAYSERPKCWFGFTFHPNFAISITVPSCQQSVGLGLCELSGLWAEVLEEASGTSTQQFNYILYTNNTTH